MITQQKLQEKFDYKNGQLIWKVNQGPNKLTGKIAGALNDQGYINIKVDGKLYKGHRLIWIYHSGDIPYKMEIDHINGVRHDNRIENLRLATHGQNQQNCTMQANNTSGAKGVNKEKNKWRARIMVENVAVHLGLFDTVEEASEAYKQAAIELHGEFANY
jgi:hypothetical protein